MRAWLLGLLTVLLVACGTPAAVAYTPDTHFATICLDGNGVRVPDTYCPIGDPGDLVDGYDWGYAPYPRTGYFDVPYVGYPVSRTVFVRQPPANVTVLNFDRGSFATAPLTGQRGNAQRVNVNNGSAVSAGSSSVTRGGLGVQTVEDDAVASSKPTRYGTAPTKRKIVTSRKKR